MCEKLSQVPMISPLQVSDLGMQFDPSRQSNSSEEHDVELSQLDRSSSAPSRESKVVTEIMIISGFRFRINVIIFLAHSLSACDDRNDNGNDAVNEDNTG